MTTCVVEVATGRFVTDGTPADGVTLVRVPVPDSPDPIRHRYVDAVSFRAATAVEMDAETTRQTDASADREIAPKAFQALLIAAIWSATGIQPTAAQIIAARQRFRTIWKSLT